MKDKKKVSKTFNNSRDRRITSKITPMPADTIADSIISAGWLLSQMDIAGGSRSHKYVGGRAVTVGLEAMEFKSPVFVGDDVAIYTEIIKQGRSSIAIKVEAYAESRAGGDPHKVTEGVFTFVHIDENGNSKPIHGAKASSAPRKTSKRKASTTDVLDHEPELKKGRVLSLRMVPFPRDKNHHGDIFGGWILTQMDLAAAVRAKKFVGGRAVPVAIDAMTFHSPVSELDEVSFYTEIKRVGETSVTIRVEAWALREDLEKYEKVTEGTFTYVAIDEKRRAVPFSAVPQ